MPLKCNGSRPTSEFTFSDADFGFISFSIENPGLMNVWKFGTRISEFPKNT